jgi:hypothetical protein
MQDLFTYGETLIMKNKQAILLHLPNQYQNCNNRNTNTDEVKKFSAMFLVKANRTQRNSDYREHPQPNLDILRPGAYSKPIQKTQKRQNS